MLALLVSITAVAVERYINRRRLRVYEVLRDVGWFTLGFALIEFSYLFVVEALTYGYGSVARPFWYTEVWVFKNLLLDAAIGVLLVLTSVWLEQLGITKLRIPLRRAPPRLPLLTLPKPRKTPVQTSASKCDVEW